MRITGVETLRLGEFERLVFVVVHTDAGLTGLGETYDAPEAVESYVHSELAPVLLGADPRDIEGHWNRIYRMPRLALGKSVEIRALSAVDVALWDVSAKERGWPVWRALGGASRDRIRVYNTCAGYRYSGHKRGGYHATARPPSAERPYEDLHAFLNDAGALAESLLSEGYRQMKIWPFDQFAVASGGRAISLADLRVGLEPFRKVREAVGDRMEIACELHNLWSLPAAVRIARALEEYEPVWVEDAVPMDNLDALARFREQTNLPVCASETLATRWGFREAFARQAVDIAMVDVTWAGGLSEARKIGALAEVHSLPVTPHDCVGPVTLAAGVHLCMHLPNALIQEVVRAYLGGWYEEISTGLPVIRDGEVLAPEGPGLGVDLLPEVRERADAVARLSEIP